ncbi:uncharacterized protein LOC117477208 isoform X1 [Trematomus bernacchii]|uniref:uncharacterized protein LOC117477208 isoform X1 n=1 Tax=Trematomus bernacchii TaxID=40690 RepID=UPI00146EE7EC|nr:uncharacterized protein LOC117477208 isoform X1 [Trematomus bernacchii]
MSEFRRILMSSFLMLLLHFPAASVKQYYPIVRAGDEVTLPFDNVIDDQDKCESTEWSFSDSPYSPGVTLFADGQIHKAAKAKSDRLNVTQNCSLVIKKVTEEDAGCYGCRQFRSGIQQDPVSRVYLYVVTMTEHQDNDEVTLNCSVSTYGGCAHRVKWLLQGRDVVKDHRDINTSQSSCSSASVTFLTSLFSYTTRSELFTCEVTSKITGEVHLFPFSDQSSGDATTTGTPTIHEWTSENNNKETDCKHPEGPAVWWVIMVPVGLAALIITVVTVHIWTRAKGGKKRMTKNLEQNDEDEDEDEVNYENDGGASASV